MKTVVGVMARVPSSGGKTRLAAHLSVARVAALRTAMLADTLHALESLPDVTVFFTPDDGEPEIAALAGTTVRRAPQGDGDLGIRMHHAFRLLLNPVAADAAILVGSDIPLLTPDHIREAELLLNPPGSATALAERRLVLGPADDGGYYLIGMCEAHPELFDGIEWGTESVLTDTLRVAERAGIEARLIRSSYDVDTIEDLQRMERDLRLAPSALCPNLRRWLSEA